METGVGFIKKLGLLFGITLVVYLAVFHFVEHQRVKNGPWIVEFSATEDKHPQIRISHAKFEINNLTVVMEGDALPIDFTPETIVFDQVITPPYDTPFGTVFFQDLTFQPGTLTLDLFNGHEIELIKRTLRIDRQEIPWTTTEPTVVTPEQKVPYLTNKTNEAKPTTSGNY